MDERRQRAVDAKRWCAVRLADLDDKVQELGLLDDRTFMDHYDAARIAMEAMFRRADRLITEIDYAERHKKAAEERASRVSPWRKNPQ